MTTEQSSIFTLLSEVARSTGDPASRDETLALITATAKTAIPGTDAVSISVKENGGFTTLAPTDQLALDADELQYELKEGPCVDAASGEQVVCSGEVRSDARWARYGPRAWRELEVGSQMAFEMFSGNRMYGGLNLYSRAAGAYDEAGVSLAELFAHHAAVVMGHAAKTTQYDEALATRKLIGQAIGLIMERYDVDEDRAFQFLARMSQTGNIKLRDVAREIVLSANQKAQHMRD